MPFSLMNGLAGLGQGVAEFAGRAGLEQQRADLMQKQTILADQLAGKREEVTDTRRAGIAAEVAEKEHGFLATQGDRNRQTQVQTAQIGASATLGSASIHAEASKYATNMHSSDLAKEQDFLGKQNDLNRASQQLIQSMGNDTQRYVADMRTADVYATIAAAEPEQAAKILTQNQQTALVKVQTDSAQAVQDAHSALAAEMAKPQPDAAKVASLKAQVTARELSASTEAATTSAAAAMYRTDMDAVNHFNTQLGLARTAMNSPEMSDTDKAAQKAQVDSLEKQLVGAQRSLKYSSDLLHERVGTQTGATPPGAPPPLPPGVPDGSRFNFDFKVFQAPDGRLFDTDGKPTTAAQLRGGPRAAQPSTPKVDYLGASGLLSGAGQR